MNSYVSSLTETIETVSGDLSGEQEKVLAMQEQISELEHTVSGLSLTMSEQFAGGINFIRNSAGLNGITDDWTITGTVSTDSSTDVQNNTTSDSCFVLGATSTLKQVITGVVPGSSYVISLRAKNTYTSSVQPPPLIGRSLVWLSPMCRTAQSPFTAITESQVCISRTSSWLKELPSTNGHLLLTRFTPPRLRLTDAVLRFPTLIPHRELL